METYRKLLKNRNGDIIIPVTDSEVYSSTERKVGVWYDNKTMFRKVFTGTFTTPTVGTRLTTNLISSGIDNVIDVVGYWSPNNSSQTSGEHYAYGTAALGAQPDSEIGVRVNSNKLQLLVENYAASYAGGTGSYRLAITYTKS